MGQRAHRFDGHNSKRTDKRPIKIGMLIVEKHSFFFNYLHSKDDVDFHKNKNLLNI